MAEPKTTITVRFTEDEVQKLQEICDKTFLTRCSAVRKAFNAYYDSVKRAEREGKARDNAGA